MNLLISPKALQQRGLKIWLRGDVHKTWIHKTSCFPIEIPLKNIAAKSLLSEYSEIQDVIATLRKDSQKHGYLIQDKMISHRKIPAVICFTTEAIFLKYLAKVHEFNQFQQLVKQSLAQDGLLFDWLVRYPFKVMQYADVWYKLLKVCGYFEAHPLPGCYIRQLDIKGVDSKFIEQHKGILSELLTQILPETHYHIDISGLKHSGFERRYGLRYDQPLIRLRILDKSLAIHGLTDLTLTLTEFKQLDIPAKTVFIAENKITVLAFPDYPKAIVIFGLGYAVNLLADARCMQKTDLYYWGDIDTNGFSILSRYRKYYPQVQSLFMGQQTLDKFIALAGVEEQEKSSKNELENLRKEELILYKKLQSSLVRLEQERISFSFIQEQLKSCLSSPEYLI